MSVHSKQLNDAFSALGFDRGQQMILDYDSFVLLQFIDDNFDGKISRTELLSHF